MNLIHTSPSIIIIYDTFATSSNRYEQVITQLFTRSGNHQLAMPVEYQTYILHWWLWEQFGLSLHQKSKTKEQQRSSVISFQDNRN